MGLLDAFKQYVRDAMPGGALNPEVTKQGLLDTAAVATTPVPVLGDLLGLAADVKRLKDNPQERTPMNIGLSALGVLPFVPSLAGMFVGKGSKTWDALSAAKAQEMASKGVDPRQIWKETGTFKGPDGHWRQEIPDNEAVFPVMKKYRRAPFDHLAMHEPLEAAYPDVKNIIVEGSPGGSLSGGSYTANVNFHDFGPRENILIRNSDESRIGNTSIGLHELQHAIQQREGWAKGGSPELFTQQADAVTARDAIAWADELEKVRRANPGMDAIAAENQLIKTYQDMDFADAIPSRTVRDLARQPGVLFPQPNALNQKKDLIDLRNLYGLDKRTTPYQSEELYRRLAGEAEARATQARMNMNAAQRREVFPLDSYDVPVDQLIIRGLLD